MIAFQVQILNHKRELVFFHRIECDPAFALDRVESLQEEWDRAWRNAGVAEVQIITEQDLNWIGPRLAADNQVVAQHFGPPMRA